MTNDEIRKAKDNGIAELYAITPRLEYVEKQPVGNDPGFVLTVRGGELNAVNALGRRLLFQATSELDGLRPRSPA